jgi:hypothetical protein
MTDIEVPVKKIVKDYFLHESNLGSSGIVTKKSELGRMIFCLLGFDPLDEDEAAVYISKNLDVFGKMEVITLNLTFPVRSDFMHPNHLFSIGDAMWALFEREFFCFCAGRFTKSINFLAATKVFLKLYNLVDTEVDQDNFRRVMERKYKDRIESLVLKYEEQKKLEIIDKFKAMGVS